MIPLQAGCTSMLGESNALIAGSWGLLRNAFQEFPSIHWTGVDSSLMNSKFAPSYGNVDAFGIANTGLHWSTPRLLQARLSLSNVEGRKQNDCHLVKHHNLHMHQNSNQPCDIHCA